MKQSKYILLSIAVALVIVLGFVKTDKKAQTPADDDTKEIASCYIWNTEAGDKMQLKVVLEGVNTDGTAKVSGFFNTYFAEKDSKVGTFEGALFSEGQQTTVRATWNTQSEGLSAQEQLFIDFTENTARPGFGEMKKSPEGIYVYADASSISYPFNLQKTDCSDSAMQ